MHLSLDNHVIRTQIDEKQGVTRKMFLRMKGTSVSQSKYSDGGYRAGESSIIIQANGSPSYDSGCHAQYFPATLDGLLAAHEAMDGYPDD